MPHCDLRVRWTVASDLRFRAAISEPETPSFCGISGDLAPSTRKSLAIAIVRFWCAKYPDLLFLAFLENSKENHQKGKDFFCLPNPENPWERSEKRSNRKEFLEKEKGKENQKGKEKKIRVSAPNQHVTEGLGGLCLK